MLKEEFCEYIRMNEKGMYYLAYSILHNDADVADCISEAIYRAYKNINHLKKADTFKPWIMSIIHNTAVEMIRKNAKTIPVDAIEIVSLDNHSRKITNKISVQESIKSLKQPYHTVVILYYYENLSIKEIAKITKTTTIAVKKQLSRARSMLKEKLEEEI